jgi:hypothetical protein
MYLLGRATRRLHTCARARAPQIELPFPCSNEDYEKAMGGAIDAAKEAGVEVIAFGGEGVRTRAVFGCGTAVRHIA